MRQDLLTSKTIDFLMANAKLSGDGAPQAEETEKAEEKA